MVRETRHLWVANLPDNTREDRIREHFQRYGRVQSVKIIPSSGIITTVPSSQPSPPATITSTTEPGAGQQTVNGSSDHLQSSIHQSGINNSRQHHPTLTTNVGSISEPSIGVIISCSNVLSNNVTSSNGSGFTGTIGICATIAFMDIKSASKAHTAEHKFDERILTTEYYEPSTMHHGININSDNVSIVNNSKLNGDGMASGISDIKQDSMQQHGRYGSTSSGHGSSDDHSPGYERTNFYDRTSQNTNRGASETASDFIRRSSNYDIRGRQRDRHFRNSPYSLIVDRPNPISHHRLTPNTWYETSPSSTSSRNHYNSSNINNNTNSNTVVQQPDSSYDRHNTCDLIDTASISTTSVPSNINSNTKLASISSGTTLLANSEPISAVPYKSKLLINNHHHHHHHHNKSLKSRSGSESPISGRSSRTNSRSPSSCSSTNSSHSETPSSHESSPSPAGELVVTHSTPSSHHLNNKNNRHLTNSTGKSTTNSLHQRHRRNLQASLATVPITNSADKPVSCSTTSSLSSSTGSASGSNPAVHSEDNRPLAICVKNLPLRSSDTSLKDGLFHEYKKHGKVTWVKVVGQSQERYALVCFKKPEDVEKALEVSQDKLFFGCKIEVQPYQGYDVDDNEFRPYEVELDEYHPKSTRTLFIGNLEKDITATELRKHFDCFGEILEIDIKKQGPSPYAFCQYADIVSVVKAMRAMDGDHLGTNRLKLGFGKSMPTNCVWLDGVVDVNESYLTQQCSRFGTVQKVTIDRERKMALVTFDQIQYAQQAVKELRGMNMRGRKIQIDFASRECVDAFYGKMEKQLGKGAASGVNFESAASASTTNSRYLASTLSRSRASSFSRPGNPVSGTTSPTSAGSTPRHLSSSGSVGRRGLRYAGASPEIYDSNEYLDTYGSYDQERQQGCDSDHINDAENITSSSIKRRCDKSPGDIKQEPRVDSESANSGITSSSSKHRWYYDKRIGDVKTLECQRHKILDQLEKYPSSGDEAESPRKRVKYSQDVDDGAHLNSHHDSSTTNCNGKVLDHRESSAHLYNHHRYHHNDLAHLRKTVEIRRLSDCNIKHSASVPGGAMTSSTHNNGSKPGRRPSTDSLSRYGPHSHETYQAMMHKRRKTSATASTSSSSSTATVALNDNEHHPSKARGHPLNSIISFETSGGESADGSRPGTPLFDERPENAVPSDPRREQPPSHRPREPISLPLPKFAQAFHQQLRQQNQLQKVHIMSSETSVSSHLHNSSLKNRSLSPTPAINQQPSTRARSNSLMPPISSGSSASDPILSSPRPSSPLSNMSDSAEELDELSGPSSSPSLEERLKKLSEDYDSWSSNGRSNSSSHSHYVNNFRHTVPEIAVPDTPELLKAVLKKNSIFDEDLKRLENINDKYQSPAPTKNVIGGTFVASHLSLSGTSSPLMSMMGSMCQSPLASLSTPVEPIATPTSSALSNTLGKLHMPAQQPVTISTAIHHRLSSSGTGSPLNSPNTASPYNSPNPSSASSITSMKGMQYPFLSHPSSTGTIVTTSCNSSISTSVTSAVCSNSVAQSTPSGTAITMATSATVQKPKTCALGKSVSLQEVAPALTQSLSTPTTGINNNSNNFNSSSNKSSTNNINNNSNEKVLMKSTSLPTYGAVETNELTLKSVTNENIEKSSAPTSDIQQPSKAEETKTEIPKKEQSTEVNNCEKKNHAKDRRKNSEHDEAATISTPIIKDEVKKETSFRKEKDSKKINCKDAEPEKRDDDKKHKIDHNNLHKKKSRDEIVIEDKKIVSEAPPAMEQRPASPARKRRLSIEDVSSVDSTGETNHTENNKTVGDKISKDPKHHEATKSSSKHHHHHHHHHNNHKEKKASSKEKEKSHQDEESHSKPKQNDATAVVNSSKDSIFDELKKTSKENIIKTTEKAHKIKKHHHHNHHRDNQKDTENQTPTNFNDTSSSVMTEDLVDRSSEEDVAVLRHNNHNSNNAKRDFNEEIENHQPEMANKKLNHHDDHNQKNRKVTESSEEGSCKKKYSRRNLNDVSSDDDDDSDDNKKKRSIFEIANDEPYVSMYDKVKARSCKNSKKQEEEKKIKDKFSALKKSRAKREKKRFNSSDESDSDMDENDMYQNKHGKSRLSSSEEEMHAKESDPEINSSYSRTKNRFSDLWDDETSESGNDREGLKKSNKLSSNRKNSRTNIIGSDSSDDEMKQLKARSLKVESSAMITSEEHIDEHKKDAQSEATRNNHKHGSNGSKKRHHDKSKEEKVGKKSKKLSKELRKSSSSTENIPKRDEKMEDIFGPISDDEPVEKTEIKNEFNVDVTNIKKEPISTEEPIKSESSEMLSKERQREESKKRKEKRRREREKQRAIVKHEEENSVDLDEAGRALEAQLMSDSEQKNNETPATNDSKQDDVFRFTDGDDEMKRDHHDSKRKKKKKKTKEDRKHHHHNQHLDSLIKQEPIDDAHIESVAPFNNNNNNTKLRLDVISNDVKPSVPSLTEETPIQKKEVVADIKAEIPSVQPVKKEIKIKPEMTIPGFGGAVDETVHEKAVLSIANELEKKPISPKIELPIVEAVTESKVPVIDPKSLKADADKIEEKSRVVISQEETEDAVAALLGESFSMATEDYNDYDVPIVTETEATVAETDVIAPEEDEEMKNAIMSLNQDLDQKPETPQSEHDLQIDTDTEEPIEDEEASSQLMRFDNPPKTPDVDISQMDKDKQELAEAVKKMPIEVKKIEHPVETKVIEPKTPVKTPPIIAITQPEKVKECLAASPTKTDEPKTVKLPEKKELVAEAIIPQVIKPMGPSYQSRYHPPSIIIPHEHHIVPQERISPRKQQNSPNVIPRPTQHLSPSASASNIEPLSNGQNRVHIGAASVAVKTGPIAIPPNTLNPQGTGSAKIIAIPNKADIKPILIHPPVVQQPHHIRTTVPAQQNSPTIVQKPGNVIISYPAVNTETQALHSNNHNIQVAQKLTPLTPAEKKMDPKSVNNLMTPQKVGISQAQQNIIVQQAIAHQQQIIYPPTGIIQTTTAKPEPSKIPEVKEKSEQWQVNSSSVIHKTDSIKDQEPLKNDKKTTDVDTSHDEEDFEESSADSSIESKKTRGSSRQQRGRKGTIVQSPPSQEDASIQTRRGGKTTTASKRGGRAARNNAKNVIPPPSPQQTSMPSPAAPSVQNNMRQQKTSESDVYEFHDDSGEELNKSGDSQRPRLIVTIKSSAVTTTASSHPIMTSSMPAVPIPTTVTSTPITVPTVMQTVQNEQPTENCTVIPSPPNQQQISSPAHSDDFAQPNNTRKSRRLQERDGPRTSVDDTIDDVVRNLIISQNLQMNTNVRRATRQTVVSQPNPVVQVSTPIIQQTSVNPALDNKKPLRANKKQKDRKASETSESESEKKPEIVQSIPEPNITQPPPVAIQQPVLVPDAVRNQVLPPKQPEMMVIHKTIRTDATEPLQLIDPVTGELKKMTQSKEGQYVPVPENRAQMQKQQQMQSIHASGVPPVPHVDVKIDDKKILSQSVVTQSAVKLSSPVVMEPPKPVQSIETVAHVSKPVITQNPQVAYTKPQPLKTYVLNSQNQNKPQSPTIATVQNPPTTVISSSSSPGVVKMNVGGIVQQPSTIYNLPNIIPSSPTQPKYVAQPAQQKPISIVTPAQTQHQPTIIHHNPTQVVHSAPQILHHPKIPSNGPQPQIVIHSQPHPMSMGQPHQHPNVQQSSGNLMINIPASSAGIPAGVSSPRMTVKQVYQRSAPPPQSPATTVVVKPGQQQQQHLVTSNQDPKVHTSPLQTTYIPSGTKIIQTPGENAPISFISNNREIIYVGTNVQKHTMYPNYPTKHVQQSVSVQTKPPQTIQQVVQAAPQKGVDKIPSQPSVSVHHIQIPSAAHQQKVYFTNSGQVIANAPPSAVTDTSERIQSQQQQQQHWMPQEKIMQPTSHMTQAQPLKNRYIMESYEHAQREQIQAEKIQQQPIQQVQSPAHQVKRSYVIEGPSGAHPLPSNAVNQPIIPPQNKTLIGLNQTPQILTGAVASPPLKAHLTSQQPIVTGASSSRVAIPPISPQDPQHQQRLYIPDGFDEPIMQHSDRSAYRSQSPPPAHQTSPLTTRPPYMLTKVYHQQPSIYMRGQEYPRLPISRMGIPGTAAEMRELSEIDEPVGASPPLELRRTTTSMPLQSPVDRITDSPMLAPTYLPPRIAQPYFSYEADTIKSEPPPAHRAHAERPPQPIVYPQPQQQPSQLPANLTHIREREREHREKEIERASIPSENFDGNSRHRMVYATPQASPAQSLVAPITCNTSNRPSPPTASQVPVSCTDTLPRLLERYPLMWQGLLALKTDQAAVQMHFVYGNKDIARASLPFNSDRTTPPLRIAQRMRLEQAQIEGVARKMEISDEHCILLALPCGRDFRDVVQQSQSLQNSFISYLQQKQAAGIINIADPGSQNATYVVHIFPSCTFANDSLNRIAPDLMHRIAEIAHLVIVIATV